MDTQTTHYRVTILILLFMRRELIKLPEKNLQFACRFVLSRVCI